MSENGQDDAIQESKQTTQTDFSTAGTQPVKHRPPALHIPSVSIYPVVSFRASATISAPESSQNDDKDLEGLFAKRITPRTPVPRDSESGDQSSAGSSDHETATATEGSEK